MGTISANPYRVSATMTLRESVVDPPMISGSTMNSGSDGIA